MTEFQLSLITASGLLLASKPESVDETKQILATGLMTALLSFSEEVHHRELQSVSFHDRIVSFIRTNDFVLIVEAITDESELSIIVLNQILEKIKQSIKNLLEGADSELLSEGEAALIIEQCMFDIQNLQLKLTEKPFNKAEISTFTIIHSDKKWEIENRKGEGPQISKVAQILDAHNVNQKFQGSVFPFITLFPEQKFVTCNIAYPVGNKIGVGVLKFPNLLDHTLFRLFPVLEKRLAEISTQKMEFNIDDILEDIKKIEDPGNRFSLLNKDNLSPSLLSIVGGRNIGKPIYSAVVGEPISIIGDKPSVKIIIDTLSIFYQHQKIDINEWVVEELRKKDKYELKARLHGMSQKTYDSLLEQKIVQKKMTLMNLESAKVTGVKTSHYFKKIFEDNKQESISKLSSIIGKELENLVSMSLIITSFSLENINEGKEKLKELELNTKSPFLFQKALLLAVSRNKLLKNLL